VDKIKLSGGVEMPKLMIISVGTGRTGDDIAKAICLSIKHQEPSCIVFIVSDLSKNRTMPLIKQNEIMFNRNYEEFLIQEQDNVEQIEIECVSLIRKIIKQKSFSPKDIVVDFTSGTKAMSAGLLLAAFNFPGTSLSYISGRRDNEGRVITGEERIQIQTPNRIYFNLRFIDAVNLFNQYQFEACFQILAQAKSLLLDQEYLLKANTLQQLSKAYSSWDKFEHKKALGILSELTKSLDNEKLLLEWEIKNIIERNKQFLYKEVNTNYSGEIAIDLLENASRRAEEGKYDDAVARLYRCLEYLGQYSLYNRHNQIETKSVDINKIPENLHNKYQKEMNKDGVIALSLFKSFELLKDLDDKLGVEFIKDYNGKEIEIKKLLSIRNNSILAHGFQPVGEQEFNSLKEILKKYINIVIFDFKEMIKKSSFPKIKIS